MKTIYLDNVRGFSETYVDLLDVNFLVGENSSGKTSFLGIAKILAESQFWFNAELSTDLGWSQFSDFVSVHGTNKSYFRIGLIDTEYRDRDSKEAEYMAILLTFEAREGSPSIKEIYVQRGQFLARAKLTSKGYVASFIEAAQLTQNQNRPFGSWLNADSWQLAQGEESKIPRDAPLFFVLFVLMQLKRGEKEKNSGSTSLPMALADSMVWIAPIRTKPKRTYDEYKLDFSAEGEHTPYLLKKLLSRKTTKKNATDFQKFLLRFGAESGLFKSVEIKKFGRGVNSPFQIEVVLSSASLSLLNVGYGVSQSLPIAVEVFARPEKTTFAIQQPEVHLHPRAQAALGEVFFNLAVAESKKFIIETHSDYLMDRFRLKLTESKQKPTTQIIFFERTATGNAVSQMPIGPDGDILGDVPDGYRRFFVNESVRMLSLG